METSMRRTSLIASTAVVAFAASALVAGNVEAKQQSRAKTINLILKEFKYTQVNNPALSSANASYPATGDLLVFSATVTNDAGASDGSLENSCTVTSGGSANWRSVCYAVYDLHTGIIDAMSLAGPSSGVKESVVGGTGHYANARGTVASKPTPNATPGSPVHETITLAP
jgi:hypothetical protein